MNIYLAFYRTGGSVFSKLIRWWTRSPYSHCELAYLTEQGVQTGQYVCWTSSERDGGVRKKVMKLEKDHWDLVKVTLPKSTAGKPIAWFADNEGKKYDWAGIFGMAWSASGDKADRYFCSEACLTALQTTGWGRGLHPSKTSPGALYEYAQAMLEPTA